MWHSHYLVVHTLNPFSRRASTKIEIDLVCSVRYSPDYRIGVVRGAVLLREYRPCFRVFHCTSSSACLVMYNDDNASACGRRGSNSSDQNNNVVYRIWNRRFLQLWNDYFMFVSKNFVEFPNRRDHTCASGMPFELKWIVCVWMRNIRWKLFPFLGFFLSNSSMDRAITLWMNNPLPDSGQNSLVE